MDNRKVGKKLLERINVFDKLKISNIVEHLILAVNPSQFIKVEHTHLIVENKAAFYALLDVLKETKYASLNSEESKVLR